MKKLICILLIIGGIFMSVKFNTSTLRDNEYATYNLNNFNGVDYTDTPTNVDDSRAIDISNYLPDGNSLYKRNGWEKLEYPFANSYSIANVFAFKDKYVFLGRSKSNPTECSFFIADDLSYTNGEQIYIFSYVEAYTTFNMAEDYNGWAIEKDDRLFVFTGLKYVMIFYGTAEIPPNSTVASAIALFEPERFWAQEVSDIAYIPTIAIGVQDNNSLAETAASYEQFNLLSNKVYVDLWLDFSNGEYTSTTNGYYWSKKGYFDLSNLFANKDSLEIKMIGSATANSARVFNTGYYGVGLLKSNGERSNTFLLLKLNGKKLEYEAMGVNSAQASLPPNVQDDDINLVVFDKKVYTEQEKLNTVHGNRSLKIQFSFDNTTALSTINKMRFGVLYGSDNNRDTLFAAGNPDYPNMDIHTCTPIEQGIEDWVSYTYFGDMTYHRIGSASSAIIGYGINNDSSLMIIKQSLTNEPNVYIRTIKTDIETVTIELSGGASPFTYKKANVLYPVFPSAINIKCNKREQVVQFDNKVMVNGKFGIYYINVNSSTAESSYDGIEASYFIRNDLSEDISDSCIIEYKDKLYVQRKSKNGKNRVYVCDKNRYSYHNSRQVYEWWVLDDVPAEKLFIFEEKLYFIKQGSLYKFTDNYFDLDKYKFTSISVGNNSDEFVTDLFFDYNKNEMIITETNEFIQDCKNSETPKEAYQDFRDKTTVELGNTIYWVLDDLLDLEQDGWIMKPSVARNEVINTIIYFLEKNNYKFYMNGQEYVMPNNWDYIYDEDTLMGIVSKDSATATGNTINVSENASLIIPIASGTKFNLSSLNDGSHDIEKCMYKEATWTYISEGVYDEIGTNVVFNHFKLAYNGVEINFALDTNYISSAKLEFRKPVKALWVSNYNHLGKLDFLKTATNIYFVPDARRGGYTHVGYRTYKKDVGFYTNSKGEGFTFNDIDFDDFTFSQTPFGRTYSSKKKIKNFSFIQLKFYSLDETDSTLVACSFRYKYSKNNKGVK